MNLKFMDELLSIQLHTPASLDLDAGDPNSGPHACTAGALPIGHVPNPSAAFPPSAED